jgi:hypothetical protein
VRGWFALAATLIFVSAPGAVGVYLQPLAIEAGLDPSVVRTAVWMGLAAQVVGSALATAMAGRLRWLWVFVATSFTYFGIWALLGHAIPAWLFVGANIAGGLMGLFLAPFFTPMLIEADPSRRTAMQIGAAQLIGGALGPFLAAQVVSEHEARGVLWLGGGLLICGLAAVTWLHLTHRGADPPS